MTPHFETAVIIGVGLLGGSLGLDLKARGLADVVRGVGRRQASLDAALAKGAVDEVSMDAAAACDGAGLVVLCTPAALVIPTLDAIRPVCPPHAVLTDVASTKAAICRHAQAAWPAPRPFVGSHPMAGSEKFGPQHARAGLYEGTVTLIEEGGSAAPETREAIAGLWRALGCRVVPIAPERHDAILACTSHVPHVAAAALARLAMAQGNNVRAFVGNGFRDATRIAGGRPEIWRDICLTNGPAIAEGLRCFAAEIEAVRARIEAGDGEALAAFFAAGQAARDQVLES